MSGTDKLAHLHACLKAAALTLLPCPFCGSDPQIGRHDPGAPYAGGYYYVDCVNEECPVSVECEEKAHTADAAEAIVRVARRWNTRTLPL